MSKKLTLSVSEAIVAKAKRYAREHHTSLSALVEQYFNYLTTDRVKESDEITPMVAELTGIIDLEDAMDAEEAYGEHLEDKYLK